MAIFVRENTDKTTVEHSEILMTFIKIQFSIKILVLSIFKVLLYNYMYCLFGSQGVKVMMYFVVISAECLILTNDIFWKILGNLTSPAF